MIHLFEHVGKTIAIRANSQTQACAIYAADRLTLICTNTTVVRIDYTAAALRYRGWMRTTDLAECYRNEAEGRGFATNAELAADGPIMVLDSRHQYGAPVALMEARQHPRARLAAYAQARNLPCTYNPTTLCITAPRDFDGTTAWGELWVDKTMNAALEADVRVAEQAFMSDPVWQATATEVARKGEQA